MDITKKIVEGFAWQSVSKFIVQVSAWTSTIFVARLLDPVDYGVMAIIGLFIGFIAIVIEWGFAQGLVQKDHIDEIQEDNVFYLLTFVGIGFYFLFYFMAPLLQSFYGIENLANYLRLAAFGIVLGAIRSVPRAMVMRKMDFAVRAFIDMGSAFASIVVVVVMAIKGYGVLSLIWAYLTLNIVSTACYLLIYKKIPRSSCSYSAVRDIVGFGGTVVVNNILYYFYSRADVFILSKTLGEKTLGYYSMAFQLASIPLDKIGAIFNQVTFPAMSRLQHDLEESQSIFLKLHGYLIIVALPVLVGLYVVSDDLILLLLTEKWLEIVPIIEVFCLLNILRISGMLMPTVLYGRGKEKLVSIYSVSSLAVLPAGFLVGVNWGIQGVLYAWVVCYPFLYLMITFLCIRELEISWIKFFKTFYHGAICTFIMYLVIVFLEELLVDISSVYLLVVQVSAGALAYFLSFALIFSSKRKEVVHGLKMLRSGLVV